MSNTDSASAIALPSILPRRGFLRGLATLPLIGGSVSILGAPVRADVPVTVELLEAYKTWLDTESRFLAWEMADNPEVLKRYKHVAGLTKSQRSKEIGRWIHFDSGGYTDHGQPSTRAAAVLTAVGCDWRDQ